jgi:iron only hydrogenase large subunit-like protein
MASQSPEIEAVITALKKKEKLVALVAPSFVIDFPFPNLIGKLRRLGFLVVVEVAFGANHTNQQLLDLMNKHPEGRFITNPCPLIVRLVKARFPELVKYLTPIDSPMAAAAKIIKDVYPQYRPIFIGPCIAKKYEAHDDVPELGITVLTYKELSRIFELQDIHDDSKDADASFDMGYRKTRLYPISGGLVQSSNISDFLPREAYRVVSGVKFVNQALGEFARNTDIKLLDILFCDGGCIGGPGIISSKPLSERRKAVVDLHTQDFIQKV